MSELIEKMQSRLLERVEEGLFSMSRASAKVARCLLASPHDFMRLPLGQISEQAGVSEPSVIRFCQGFGYKGVADFRMALALSLAHAESASSSRFVEPNVADKAVVNLTQKGAIADAAVTLLGDAQAILVDSGSTMQIFAQRLVQAPPLRIMTTSLNVAHVLCKAPRHTVLLSGGVIRTESQSLSGELVEHTLSRLHFDILFLGADAINLDFGLSTYNEQEARQNSRMVEVSTRVIVLADSAKFRSPCLHRCCGLEQVDCIVTDSGLSDDVFQTLLTRGIQVVRAPLSAKEKKWSENH